MTVGPRGAREVEHLPDDLGDARDLVADDAGVLDHVGGVRPLRGGRKLHGPTLGCQAGRALRRPFCSFGHGPRAPAHHVEGRSELVRDLGGHLADRRQLLRLAQPRLELEARAGDPLGLLARLAQRPGHGVESPGDGPDLVVALGQDHPRQIALADRVDPLEQTPQRPHDDLFDREANADRHADHHQQKERVDPTRGGRHLGVDVAGVAPHPHDRRRVARRVPRRELQRGGVEQRHGHGVRPRARRRIEEAADRRVLDVDAAHEQEPGVVVGAALAADRQHLHLEQLIVLAGGAGARQQRLLRRAGIERLDTGAQRGGDLVRLAIEIRLQVRAPHLERGVAGAASTAATKSVTTTVTRVPSVIRPPL